MMIRDIFELEQKILSVHNHLLKGTAMNNCVQSRQKRAWETLQSLPRSFYEYVNGRRNDLSPEEGTKEEEASILGEHSFLFC